MLLFRLEPGHGIVLSRLVSSQVGPMVCCVVLCCVVLSRLTPCCVVSSSPFILALHHVRYGEVGGWCVVWDVLSALHGITSYHVVPCLALVRLMSSLCGG